MAVVSALAMSEKYVVPLTAILFPSLFYVCIIVHEVGHAAAAVLAGFRVHMITVYPFSYRPRSGGFMRAARSRSNDFAGLVFATKPEGMDWNKGRAWFVLGGPLGNFVLAAAAYGMGLSMGFETSIGIALFGLFASSFLFGIANLVPAWGPGKRRTDGAALIDALRGKRPSEQSQRLTRLLGDQIDGPAASKWSDELVAELESSTDPDSAFVRNSLLLNTYLSKCQLPKAKQLLAQFDFEQSPHLISMYAFVSAMVDRNGEVAAKILDDVPSRLRPHDFGYWRARAVVFSLLGNRKEALDAVARGKKLAQYQRAGDAQDRALFAAIESGVVPSWEELQKVA